MNDKKDKLKISEIITSLIILFLIGWFIFSVFDDSCELDGCDNDGIGWEKSMGCSSFSYSICRPDSMGGYCSKDHAIEDNY